MAVLAIMEISTGYQLLGLLHIVAAIAAFGPMLMYPSLRDSDPGRLAKLYLYLTLPALTLVWVFGMGLVGMSKNLYEMSDPWIMVSLLLWVIAMAVGWFLIRPAIKGGEQTKGPFSAGVGVTHLVLIVTLIMMVFKPGA